MIGTQRPAGKRSAERIKNAGRSRRFVVAGLCAFAVSLFAAAAALAFNEFYGNYEIGNGGYVSSAGAHTFRSNVGAGANKGQLACQLFNGSTNNVSHGNGSCGVTYNGGQYVWARVYDQSGARENVLGYAGT